MRIEPGHPDLGYRSWQEQLVPVGDELSGMDECLDIVRCPVGEDLLIDEASISWVRHVDRDWSVPRPPDVKR